MKTSSVSGGLALVLCTTTVLYTASAALAVEVVSKMPVKASADKAWAALGDFCGIKTWHPVIANCEMSKKGDTTYRTLTTKDGAKIFEQELNWDDKGRSYSYAIIESPLPVANYKATMNVAPNGDHAEINWTANFEPKGPEEDAKKVIGGIFSAGLDSLKAKLNSQ